MVPITTANMQLLSCKLPIALRIAALFSAAYAIPSFYDYGIETNTKLERRQQTWVPMVTTGVQNSSYLPDGSLPQRVEIRDLQANPVKWTLYLLGLDYMQRSSPQSDMKSWYQVCGIHGRPFAPWDNVYALPGNEDHGYCQHASIIFPPWHRPYVALYEQILYNNIQTIAQMYPKGNAYETYTTAAQDFRVPYWDWAATPSDGSSNYPTIFGTEYVAVNGPLGEQEIWNPLWSYPFNPMNATELPDFPMSIYNTTLRYPTNQTQQATSQNDLVSKQIQNSSPSLRARLYNLFTNYHDFTTFSNDQWISLTYNPHNYDSIESVHNTIHSLVGNGGHMNYADYAGQDPVFMLHHAMIDRLFAMWQVVNQDSNNSYVNPEPALYSTFTSNAYAVQDVNTPLTPFRKNIAGDFWTSADVHGTEVFSYQYPETATYTGQNVTQKVINAINTLYGSCVAGAVFQIDTTNQKRSTSTAIFSSGAIYNEWKAGIVFHKRALGAPFNIYLFIGPFNSDPWASPSWSMEPNLAGYHGNVIRASPCSCQADDTASAELPLTSALIKHMDAGELKSLDPEDVVPFLMGHLQYRITLANDTAVSNGDPRLTKLKINVLSSEVQSLGGEGSLPIWGPWRGEFDISTD